jgi:hypothetical protein
MASSKGTYDESTESKPEKAIGEARGGLGDGGRLALVGADGEAAEGAGMKGGARGSRCGGGGGGGSGGGGGA